jgi:hypothetical protein
MTIRQLTQRAAIAAMVGAGVVAGASGYASWRDHSPRHAYSHTLCDDGWISHSRGPGTCSWHDGVDRYVYVDVPAPPGGWSSVGQ